MPRRVTPSQLKSMVRKQQRAIDNYSREVKRVNAHNKRVVDDYNRQVRAHNSRVCSNQRRLQAELNKLASRQTTTTRYVTYQASVQTLQRSFVRIAEASAQERWTADDELFEMSEGEAANSAAVLNALLDEPITDVEDGPHLRETTITTELLDIDPDFDARWQGALFALHLGNPDAARQFCTSSREIFIDTLELKAPDATVLAAYPKAQLNDKGQVLRREKIKYCLGGGGEPTPELVDFASDDINNVMDLFHELSSATHGRAGRYDLNQLSAIKQRVEGAIQFLHRIVSF